MTGYVIAAIAIWLIILALLARAACMGNRNHEIIEEGPPDTLAPGDDPADWHDGRIVKELKR